ncbi:hypothetical protein ABZ490_10440 [Streptomyces sp. NPDC005811]|uniref:hypothetical protein n=1 Tax=Streptomyces sp. NPDC005811 TaxID=3154565 RepID=UPI0033D1B65C
MGASVPRPHGRRGGTGAPGNRQRPDSGRAGFRQPAARSLRGTQEHEQHEHDRGLSYDLPVLARRRTIRLMAAEVPSSVPAPHPGDGVPLTVTLTVAV